MKRIIFICALAALAVACSKNDDYGVQVSNETIYEFNDRFPNAKSVSWEKRGIYKVAVFNSNGEKLTAWYQQDGTWCMTEKRLDEATAPAQVMNAYKLSESRTSSMNVSHVDRLTRDIIDDIYVVVVNEGNGIAEFYYAANGIPVKTIESASRVYEDYRNEIVPQIPDKVFGKVAELYPSARIMEVDVIFPGVLYVDIIDNLVLKTMEFSLTGSWSMTYWEVSEQYVKTQAAAVYEAYKKLGYNDNCSIKYVEVYQTPSLIYYSLYLDNNGTDGNVKIAQDGRVIVVS